MTPSTTDHDPRSDSGLKVTAYEKASSVLVSLLLVVGVAAVGLFVVWVSTVLVFVEIPRKSAQMIRYPGRGDHDAGFARDPEGPGVEELDVMMDQPQLEAALTPVSNLASTIAVSYDIPDAKVFADIIGDGDRGDDRPVGDEADGDNVVPPWQRWVIRYDSTDMTEYRRQLDFFGIEVGAVGGTKLVDYAFNVSSHPISTRKGSGKKEGRVYLTWKPNSPLREFDESILRDAGIATENRIVMQFLPKSVYDELHRLERAHSDHHPLEWLKTYFKVRRTRNGYEFYIDEQLFRPRPMKATVS